MMSSSKSVSKPDTTWRMPIDWRAAGLQIWMFWMLSTFSRSIRRPKNDWQQFVNLAIDTHGLAVKRRLDALATSAGRYPPDSLRRLPSPAE